MICGECGGETIAEIPSDVKELIKQSVLVGEMCDPGGRLLTFQDGTEVRLSDYCSSCDFETIRKALAK